MITLEPIREILGMGGPWISHLVVDGKQTEIIVLDQDVVYSDDKSKAVFAIYKENHEKIYFEILIVNLEKKQYFLSRKQFEQIFVQSFLDNKVKAFLAFHNNIKNLEIVMDFN